MKLVLGALIVLGTLSQAAQAAGVKDLTPVSVSYRKVLLDDVSGAQGLRVSIFVKNVGQQTVRAGRGGIMVAAIWNTSAALYGPVGNGGYNLAAPIAPGQTGMFLFTAPLTALTHCLKSKVWIDTTRSQQLQSGPTSIYLNDSKILPAVDTSSIKLCPGGIFQP